jgi:hypothetical protein
MNNMEQNPKPGHRQDMKAEPPSCVIKNAVA